MALLPPHSHPSLPRHSNVSLPLCRLFYCSRLCMRNRLYPLPHLHLPHTYAHSGWSLGYSHLDLSGSLRTSPPSCNLGVVIRALGTLSFLGRALRYPNDFPDPWASCRRRGQHDRHGKTPLCLHDLRKSALAGGARLDCCASSRRATFVVQCSAGAALTARHVRATCPYHGFLTRQQRSRCARKTHRDVGMGRSRVASRRAAR